MRTLTAALTLVAATPFIAATTTTGLALPRDAGATARRAPHEVTIYARDFAFDAPDSVASGITTIHLINKGAELHHVVLIRLSGGHTMADLGKALASSGPPPRWATSVGGPNSPVPGGTASATLDLAPGSYVMVCFIPSADGVPHVMKGMIRPLIVTGPDVASPLPKSDVTVTLTDYSFDLSHPFVAGHQVVRIHNAATQDHELFLVRLAPGKTVQDLTTWTEKMTGPPPAIPLGGVTALGTGHENEISVDLTPGQYGLVCFLPDLHDGKPHFAHGMTKAFTIA
jgi:hypothetical protein